jgi:hypothetical protein
MGFVDGGLRSQRQSIVPNCGLGRPACASHASPAAWEAGSRERAGCRQSRRTMDDSRWSACRHDVAVVMPRFLGLHVDTSWSAASRSSKLLRCARHSRNRPCVVQERQPFHGHNIHCDAPVACGIAVDRETAFWGLHGCGALSRKSISRLCLGRICLGKTALTACAVQE